MNTFAPTAAWSLASPHQLLDHYLQILHDAKVRQVKMFATWASLRYSRTLREFLTEQQQLSLQQRDSLKELEQVYDVLLSGAICRPVRCLLQEANQVAQLPEIDFDLAEPLMVQLLHCAKHYELIMGQSALELASNIEESTVAGTLAKITAEDGRASLKLQNLLVTHWEDESRPDLTYKNT